MGTGVRPLRTGLTGDPDREALAEVRFQDWYAEHATKLKLAPDPDDPLHFYDYRAAFKAGAEPKLDPQDNQFHWPSEFKKLGHPNLIVNGVDTRYQFPASQETRSASERARAAADPDYAALLVARAPEHPAPVEARPVGPPAMGPVHPPGGATLADALMRLTGVGKEPFPATEEPSLAAQATFARHPVLSAAAKPVEAPAPFQPPPLTLADVLPGTVAQPDVTAVPDATPDAALLAPPPTVGTPRPGSEGGITFEEANTAARRLEKPVVNIVRALGRDAGARFALQGVVKLLDLAGTPLGLEAHPILKRIVDVANRQVEAEEAGEPHVAARLSRSLIELVAEMEMIPGATTPSTMKGFGPKVLAEMKWGSEPARRAVGRVELGVDLGSEGVVKPKIHGALAAAPERITGAYIQQMKGTPLGRVAQRALEEAGRLGYVEGVVGAAQEKDLGAAAARAREGVAGGVAFGAGAQALGEVASKAVAGAVGRQAAKNLPRQPPRPAEAPEAPIPAGRRIAPKTGRLAPGAGAPKPAAPAPPPAATPRAETPEIPERPAAVVLRKVGSGEWEFTGKGVPVDLQGRSWATSKDANEALREQLTKDLGTGETEVPAKAEAPAPKKGFRQRAADMLDPERAARLEKVETERRAVEREAETDALTGLGNRRAFERARPTADADPKRVALVADLNNFKAKNDVQGHSAGDAYLKKVADAFRTAGVEQAFRPMGDEFVGYTTKDKADAARKAIEEAVGEEEIALPDGRKVKVSVSVATGQTYDEADKALQPLKEARKGKGGSARGGVPSGTAGTATAPGAVSSSPRGASATQGTGTLGTPAEGASPAAGTRSRTSDKSPSDVAPPAAGETAATPASEQRGTEGSTDALAGEGGRGTESTVPRKQDISNVKRETPRRVFPMKVSEIHADPARFQFKQLGEEGVSNELKDVEVWDEDSQGVVSIWKDPADGKTYVINGHHRLDLAKRLGVQELDVRYIKADNAEDARSRGALINIKENRGTPVDVGKYLRDRGATIDDLKASGVSLRADLAKDGMALAKLAPDLFDQVATGKIPQGAAIAVGQILSEPALQRDALKAVSGKRLSNAEIAEVARQVRDAGTEALTQETLFGTETERHGLFIQKGQLVAEYRKLVTNDKRLFGFVSKEGRAEDLKRAGKTKIDVKAAKKLAEGSAQLEEVFDRIFTRKGPLATLLDAGARRIAHGEAPGKVAGDTYADVRDAIEREIRSGEAPSAEGRRGGGAVSPESRSVADEIADEDAAREGPVKDSTDEAQASLLGEKKPAKYQPQELTESKQGTVREEAESYGVRPLPENAKRAEEIADQYIDGSQEINTIEKVVEGIERLGDPAFRYAIARFKAYTGDKNRDDTFLGSIERLVGATDDPMAALKSKYEATAETGRAGFILPDGTLLDLGNDTHDTAAQRVGETLDGLLSQGIIRVRFAKYGIDVQIAHPMTSGQRRAMGKALDEHDSGQGTAVLHVSAYDPATGEDTGYKAIDLHNAGEGVGLIDRLAQHPGRVGEPTPKNYKPWALSEAIIEARRLDEAGKPGEAAQVLREATRRARSEGVDDITKRRLADTRLEMLTKDEQAKIDAEGGRVSESADLFGEPIPEAPKSDQGSMFDDKAGKASTRSLEQATRQAREEADVLRVRLKHETDPARRQVYAAQISGLEKLINRDKKIGSDELAAQAAAAPETLPGANDAAQGRLLEEPAKYRPRKVPYSDLIQIDPQRGETFDAEGNRAIPTAPRPPLNLPEDFSLPVKIREAINARFADDVEPLDISDWTDAQALEMTNRAEILSEEHVAALADQQTGGLVPVQRALKLVKPEKPAPGFMERLGIPRALPGESMKEWRVRVGPEASKKLGDALRRPEPAPLEPFIATHTLTPDNLAHADKLGGLAAPSMAVVPLDKQRPFEQYGTITLIGKSALADPTQTTIYDADAYTGRNPLPEYPKVRWEKMKSLVNKYDDIGKEFDDSVVGYHINEELDRGRPDRAMDSMESSTAVMASYLRSLGEEVKPVMVPARLWSEFSEFPAVQAFFKKHPGITNHGYHELAENPAYRELTPIIEAAIADWAKKIDVEEGEAEVGDRPLRQYLVDQQRERWIAGDGLVPFGSAGHLERDQAKIGTQEVDTITTREQLRERIKPHTHEFRDWVADQVTPLMGPAFLKVGGRRVPYTLENLAAATKAGTAKEAGMTFGPGDARAKGTQEFTSLQWMTNVAAGPWGVRSKAEVDAARKANEPLVEAWRSAMLGAKDRGLGFGDTWEALDGMHRALGRFLERRNRRDPAKMLRRELSKEGFTRLDDDLIEQGLAVARAILDVPVPYFEGKPDRPVLFNEFAGAVIPNDASPKVREILERRGVPFREYDPADTTDRAKVTTDFTNELRRSGVAEHPLQRYEAKRAQVGGREPGFTLKVSEAGSLKLYHGSRHEFERFDLSKVGTGQGAASYGHGLYFAEAPDVAREYRRSGGGAQIIQYRVTGTTPPTGVSGHQALDMSTDVNQYLALRKYPITTDSTSNKDMQDHIERLMEARITHWQSHEQGGGSAVEDMNAWVDYWQAHVLGADPENIEETPKGKLYEVEVEAEEGEFLDLDRPLAEQSPLVQKALTALGFEVNAPVNYPSLKQALNAFKSERVQKLAYDDIGTREVLAEGRQMAVDGKGPAFRRWFANHGRTLMPQRFSDSHMTGETAYEKIRLQRNTRDYYDLGALASQKLAEHGVRGLRYLDGFSRRHGEGTRNYVLFNDEIVKITRVSETAKKYEATVEAHKPAKKEEPLRPGRMVYHGTKETGFDVPTKSSDLGPHVGSIGQAAEILRGAPWDEPWRQKPMSTDDLRKYGHDPQAEYRVIPLVDMTTNPLRVQDKGWGSPDWFKKALVTQGTITQDEADKLHGFKAIREWLESKGYDSLIYQNRVEADRWHKAGYRHDVRSSGVSLPRSERRVFADSKVIFNPERDLRSATEAEIRAARHQIYDRLRKHGFDPSQVRLGEPGAEEYGVERIVAAVVKSEATGKEYEGQLHADASGKAALEHDPGPFDDNWFRTSTGRLVDREEGAAIAERANQRQMNPEIDQHVEDSLAAEEVRYPRVGENLPQRYRGRPLGATGGPGFRSRLVESIQAIKLEKAPAQTWISKLRGKGNSADEFDWALGEALNADPKKSWTKDEVLALAQDRGFGSLIETLRASGPMQSRGGAALHAAQAEVEAAEVAYWDATRPESRRDDDAIVALYNELADGETRDNAKDIVAENGVEQTPAILAAAERVQDAARAVIKARVVFENEPEAAGRAPEPRYPSEVEPGGRNYREILVQLPMETPRGVVAPGATFRYGNEDWKVTDLYGRGGSNGVRAVRTTNPTGEGSVFALGSVERGLIGGTSDQLKPGLKFSVNDMGKVTEYEIPEYDDSLDPPAEGYVAVKNLTTGEVSDLSERMVRSYAGIPEPKPAPRPYQDSHWDEPNVVFWIRVNDRTLPGSKKALHIEEIQSGLHQKGREEGYQPAPGRTITREDARRWFQIEQDKWDAMPEALQDSYVKELDDSRANNYRDVERGDKGVPDAPLKNTPDWLGLALKRVLDEAVVGGYDAVTWTGGLKQANRYNLRQVAERLEYDPQLEKFRAFNKAGGIVHTGTYDARALDKVMGKEGAKKLLASPLTTGLTHKRALMAPYRVVAGNYGTGGWDVVGADGHSVAGSLNMSAAEARARAAEFNGEAGGIHVLEGKDLEVGGHGMKAFYDVMLPDWLKSYGKKIGAQLEPTTVQTGSTEPGQRDVEKQADTYIQDVIDDSASATDLETALALQRMRNDDMSWAAALREMDRSRIEAENIGEDWVEQPVVLQVKKLLPSAMLEFQGVRITPEVKAALAKGQVVAEKGRKYSKFETRRMQQLAGEQGIEVRAEGINDEPEPLPSDPEVNMKLLRDQDLLEMRALAQEVMDEHLEKSKAGMAKGVYQPSMFVIKVMMDRYALEREIRQREIDTAFGGDEKVQEALDELDKAGEFVEREPPFEKPTVPMSAERLTKMREGKRAKWVEIPMVRGQTVRTGGDILRLTAPFRHPGMERMHTYLLNEAGTVLSHQKVTSGALNFLEFGRQHDGAMSPLATRFFQATLERMQRTGATEAAFVHNHPSGFIGSSGGDRVFSAEADRFFGNRGIRVRHYIIDHEEGRLVPPDGTDATPIRYRGALPPTEEPSLWDSPDAPDWSAKGTALLRSRDVLAAASAADRGDGQWDLLYVDSQMRPVALESHNIPAVRTMATWFPQRLRAHGALRAFVVTGRPDVALPYDGLYAFISGVVQRERVALAGITDIISLHTRRSALGEGFIDDTERVIAPGTASVRRTATGDRRGLVARNVGEAEPPSYTPAGTESPSGRGEQRPEVPSDGTAKRDEGADAERRPDGGGRSAVPAGEESPSDAPGGRRLERPAVPPDEAPAGVAEPTPRYGPDFRLDPESGVLRAPDLAKVVAQFSSRGDLPGTVLEEKIAKDGWIAAQLSQIQFTTADFKKAAKIAYGRQPTPAEAALLDAALKGDNTVTIPPEMWPIIQQMRSEIDALSQAMIQIGVVEGDLAARIGDNLGVYVTRSYRVHDDPTWARKVPDAIRNQAKAYLRAEYPGRTPTQIDALIQYFLEKFDSPVGIIAKGGALGSKDLSTLIRRKDIAPEIRALWGEYHDPLVNYARSVAKMASLVSNHLFLETVRAEGLGRYFFEQPEQVGDISFHHEFAAEGSKVLEPLNGLFTTPEIAQAFRESVQSVPLSAFGKWYMRVNGTVKLSKAVLSVMGQVRNFVSNTGFMIANSHYNLPDLPKTLGAIGARLGWSSSAAGRAYWKRMQALGVVEGSARGEEVLKVLEDMALDVPRPGITPGKVIKGVVQPFATAYQLGDAVWKVLAFENERGRYQGAYPNKTPEEIEEIAAGIVRRTFPTYSMTPAIIRSLRRFPFVGTFPTFAWEVYRTLYETIKLTGEELGTFPSDLGGNAARKRIGAARLAGLVAAATVIAGLVAASRYYNGITPERDRDLRRFLAPWSKNSQIFYLGRDEQQRVRYVDLGYSDPYSYARDPLLAFLRGETWEDKLLQSIVEASRPFLSEEILAGHLVDIARNVTATGLQVYNPEAPALERAKSVMAHLYDAVEPGVATQARRIQKGLTGEQLVYGQGYDPKLEAIATFTGQRIQVLDVGQALQFKALDFSRRIENANRQMTSVIYRRGTVSDDDLRQAVHSTERSRHTLFEDLVKDAQGANRLGMTQTEVRKALENGGLSRSESNAVSHGRYPPYIPGDKTWKNLIDDMPGSQEEAQRRRKVIQDAIRDNRPQQINAAPTPPKKVSAKKTTIRVAARGEDGQASTYKVGKRTIRVLAREGGKPTEYEVTEEE